MGKPPTTIIMDQNAAMRLAILSKMSHMFHKLCRWYITHKTGDKVGRVYQDHEAMNEFYEILNNSENVNALHKYGFIFGGLLLADFPPIQCFSMIIKIFVNYKELSSDTTVK